MSKRKDEALRKLSNYNLRVLAESVSNEPISPYAARSDLIKLIEETLSIDEINRMANEIGHAPNAAEGGVFASSGLLKGGIVLVFATAFLDYIYFASFYGAYPIYYAYNSSIPSVGMIRLVGLAMIVYWFFSSALRTIGNNRAAAAVLALGGAILIAAILIILQLMWLGLSYYRATPF